jgi:hypothetical protein
MLASQQKVANVQARAAALAAAVEGLIRDLRDTELTGTMPPMLSKRYFAQIQKGL